MLPKSTMEYLVKKKETKDHLMNQRHADMN